MVQEETGEEVALPGQLGWGCSYGHREEELAWWGSPGNPAALGLCSVRTWAVRLPGWAWVSTEEGRMMPSGWPGEQWGPEILRGGWGSLNADSHSFKSVKNLPAMQETWVWLLGREDPLEEGMATPSNILAWRIPWTEEPGGLQSVGSQGSDTT